MRKGGEELVQNVLMKDKRLSDLFPEVINNDVDRELFSAARIHNINVYKKSRKLEIFIVSDTLIPAKTLDDVEQSFKRMFGLEQVHLRVSFNIALSIEEVLDKYWDSILYMTKKNIALCRGILSGCKWKIEDKKLCIYLKTKGTEILKCKNCDTLIENIIKECFGLQIRVEFKDSEINEDKINEYIEFKENEEAKVVTDTVIKNIAKPVKTSGDSKKSAPLDSGDKSEVILGKNFNDSVMNMSEVTQDSGRIAVKGEIIRTETRELKSGKLLYIFDVTDLTSSLTVKIFLDKDKSGSVMERIKEKANVKIRGEQYDKFSRELTVLASDIVEVSVQTRNDNAGEKRVELHLHTQMSAMDGVTSVKDLIKRAAQWGHKAIAVTDHGVVQAYPDACDAAKKNKIKVIYGIEAYLLDDSVPIVYRSNGHPVDGEFVVFDIETTGLSADKDKITEIGAVKIKEGKIVDTFSTFVNPEIPIPELIVNLTGITDDLVADAPTIDKALPQFLEFVGNSPLVAHNAVFDTGFIRYNAFLMNKNVENPVIDTLELSRQMFPELKKHKLDIVAKHLGVSLENHHRA
ncbi:DNA polymerase III alpha subunit [Acetivibrio straminisolvens JCM 21531]|uniref:DNA polymerase III alpha subunit n=1 Tax=Acetivibrio straminisolvens JCM 21531 TaxID=1294263 RepID=W4V3V9_9FIRM|nr:DNA polymerase III alpha subunit [Acetivibrio straminisolvens JCM 21531]